MTLNDTIHALGDTAADLLSMARTLEETALPPADPIDPTEADQLAWGSECRYSAGACIAAINHLNGVSPE
ncbi:hypothetical protein [Ottowia oryzae]